MKSGTPPGVPMARPKAYQGEMRPECPRYTQGCTITALFSTGCGKQAIDAKTHSR